MQGETKERWMLLAEQAAVEQDPEKFIALIKEIDELLAKKQDRLQQLPHNPKTQS
jgi:predicted sugar kinase